MKKRVWIFLLVYFGTSIALSAQTLPSQDQVIQTMRRVGDFQIAQPWPTVETYGFDGKQFYGKSMKEVSAILNDMWKNCCQELKAGGGKRAVQAWLPEPKTMDELKTLADHYNL